MIMHDQFESLAPEWLQFKSKIDDHLKTAMNRLSEPGPLQEACRYAVLGGGKRLRPSLSLLIAKAAGGKFLPLEAAVAVEFFHIASLVADDLPCMDDDDWRRGKWTVHKKFGTATALMATYSLISEGFGSLTRACREMKNQTKDCLERTLLAFESASQCTGICGITGGQFGDLFPENPAPERVCEILRKKTGCLFDLSMAFGWIFGGGCLNKLPDIQALGSDLGTAFQICDDFEDLKPTVGKTQSLNAIKLWGPQKALMQLQELLQRCKSKSLQLRIHQGPLLNLLMAFDACLRAYSNQEILNVN